jgi:hypothetical protein
LVVDVEADAVARAVDWLPSHDVVVAPSELAETGIRLGGDGVIPSTNCSDAAALGLRERAWADDELALPAVVVDVVLI